MIGKRIISSILSMAMVFSLNAGISFAEEVPVTEDPVVEEQPSEAPVVEEEPVFEEEPVIEEEPVVQEEQETTQPEEVEDEYPAQTFTGTTPDGKISVEVIAGEGALPKDASMQVENVNNTQIEGLVNSVIDGEAESMMAVDVIFKDKDGNDVEPLTNIVVNIRLTGFEESSNYQLVHIDQANNAEKIAAENIISLDNTGASFTTDVFSVYAVIGEPGPSDNYRMTVNFHRQGVETATMYVKNADRDGQELEMILYDPGVGNVPTGQSFKGWAKNDEGPYTDTTPTQSINEIRQEIRNTEIQDGDEVDYYPVFTTTYTLFYLGEDESVIGSEAVTAVTSVTSREVIINQDYAPHDGTHNFEGWNVAPGSEANIENATIGGEHADTPYQNGTVLTIKGDVTLSVNAPAGHWLIFDENGDHATYNAPRFIKDSDVTKEPRPADEMERKGYTFGGWYKDAECSDGEEFVFGNNLQDQTTIYAKWILNDSATYTVNVWKENITCDGYDYDADHSRNLTGVPNTTINTVTLTGSGNTAYVTINGQRLTVDGFHGDHLVGADQKISPDGSTVVNVYLNRNEYTFTFRKQTGYSYTTIHTVTKKYDVDISGIWEFDGSDGVHYPETSQTTSWTPSGSSTYTARITRLQRMPAENITWTLTHSNNPERTFHYYVQTVPGESGTRTYGGNQYKSYIDFDNDFNIVYYNDDFWVLKGFTRQVITKSGNQIVNLTAGNNISWTNLNNNYGGDNNHLYFLYTRNKYDLTFMDGSYFDSNGAEIVESDQGILKEVKDQIYYEEDISSYNEGGENYFVPTRTNYTFAGWYHDKACKEPYTFDTMPLDGCTVYAKWVLNQYRVFLHPNVPSGQPLSWGGSQDMTFRVDSGNKVSEPEGIRPGYDFVGWYMDPGFTTLFNGKNYILNDDTVTTPYDKTVDMTDPMDEYGEGATYNTDVDRNWITKKLDLYAKWEGILVGATGIDVVYDANGGSNAPTDPGHYTDNSTAIVQPASTPEEGKIFDCWVLQKWNPDTNKYEDTTQKYVPGEKYTVLKDYAKVEPTPDSTPESPKNKYTIQLRAEYKDPEEETPTEITWYANNGTAESVTDSKNPETGQDLKINEAIRIRPANTFSYGMAEFLGWSKKENPTANDLFLKYENGKFYAETEEGNDNWVEVTKIAADELQGQERDSLYAVWKADIYVWHSSDASTETIDIHTLKGEDGYYLDIYDKVAANYYYGGWYIDYHGNKEESYDDVAGDRNNEWVYSEAGEQDGREIEINPDTDIGKTYYLKEVPQAYLSNYSEMIFKIETENVVNLFQMSAVDDLNYQETGFVVQAQNQKAVVVRSFIFQQDSGKTYLRRADLIFDGINNLSYLTYLDMGKLGLVKENESFTVTPYWTTKDGITVTSSKTRSINMNTLKYKEVEFN